MVKYKEHRIPTVASGGKVTQIQDVLQSEILLVQGSFHYTTKQVGCLDFSYIRFLPVTSNHDN